MPPLVGPVVEQQRHPMTVCLVSDDPVVQAAVRASCPPPHRLSVFSRKGLVSEQRVISEHGMSIVEAARTADAALVEWDLEQAPALNTLCFQIRRSLTTPVFMLCRQGPEALASAIAAGADDALTFPLYIPYIQAKVLSHRRLVEAAFRAGPCADRRVGVSGDPAISGVARFGHLRLDVAAHRFFIRSEQVELTPREFALIAYLIDHGNTLRTRDQILDAVWGIDFDTGTNMVDVYMHFLRRKLEAHGLKGMIETVRGKGYRLVETDAP